MDVERTSRRFLGAMGASLFVLWTRWMTDREGTERLLEIESGSRWGANSLRADAGGLLLAISAFLGLYFLRGAKWLAPAAVVTAAAAAGRVVSLRRDGFDVRGAGALAVELVGLGAMAVLWRAGDGE